MFAHIARGFLYLAALSPVILVREFFFPFITGKAFFFRTSVSFALLFFVLHLLLHVDRRAILRYTWERLKHPVVLAVIAFAGIAALTSLTGINPTQSFWSNFERGEGAFQLLNYAAFFVLTYLLFDTRPRIHSLLYVHLGAFLLVNGYGILQLYSDPTVEFVIARGHASGTLGNTSYLSAYNLITLFVLGYLAYIHRSNILRGIFAALGIFALFMIIKAGTRGAMLGVAGGMLTFLTVFGMTASRKAFRTASYVLIALSLVFLAVFLPTRNAPHWAETPLIGKFLNFPRAATEIKPRLWSWETALKGAIERPVIGWGMENYAYSFDAHYNPNHYGRESFFDRTHNIFLEYLHAGGILLLLSWLAIFFLYYREALRQKKDVWFALLASFPVAYLIQGFFLFDVLAIYVALYIFLALALNANDTEPEPPARYGFDVTSIVGSALIIFFVFSMQYVTTVRPLHKNILLSRAIISGQQLLAPPNAQIEKRPTLQDTTRAYVEALSYDAVYGQEEAISMFLRFSTDLVIRFSQIDASRKRPQDIENVNAIVALANTAYEDYADKMPGLKNAFILGTLNINAGIGAADGVFTITNQEHIDRGVAVYEAALETSPNRIEFILALSDLWHRAKNTERFEARFNQLQTLRPDINWSERFEG